MPTHPPPLPVWRDRLHLVDVVQVVTPSGGSEVAVHLRASDGTQSSGQGAGLAHREGTLRAAGEATLRALAPLCEGRLRLELRGVRSLRAFDAVLVIVSLLARPEGGEMPYRLIGSVAAPNDDLVRGTVMAVLDALNRVMEGYSPFPDTGAPTPGRETDTSAP